MNEKKFDTTVNFKVTHHVRDMVRAESIRRWRANRADWREAQIERDWLEAGMHLGAGSRAHDEREAIYAEVLKDRLKAERRARA